ncbi:22862_t:CDS:2, partial [Dentiscutata erythropus]
YPDCAIGTISRKDLVGPKGIPLIGNLISLLRRNTYVQYEQELANKYGSLFTITVLQHGRTIVSNDTQTIEHVLKTDFDEYGKSDDYYEIGYDIFGDGIFSVDG